MEINACVVCRSAEYTSANRLIECIECHQRYHAECHKPTVTKKEFDTRMLWICTKCNKNKKMARSPLGKSMAPNKLAIPNSLVSSQGLMPSMSSAGNSGKASALKLMEGDKLKYSSGGGGSQPPGAKRNNNNNFPANLSKPNNGNGLNRSQSQTSGGGPSAAGMSKPKLMSNNSFGSSMTPSMMALDKRFPNLKKAKR